MNKCYKLMMDRREKENGMVRMVNRWILVKKRRREILDLFLLLM